MDQVARDWNGYIEWYETYLQVTNAAGIQKNPEKEGAPCRAYIILKALLHWTGGPEAGTMAKHIGKVKQIDDWQEVLWKIKRGIRYRLMETMTDVKEHHREWYN